MKRILVPALILLVMALGAGCNIFDSTNPSGGSTTVDEGSIDLDSPTGGFTENDEEPAFGEKEAYASMNVDPLYVDQVEDDPEVQRCINNRHARVFRLRSIWGKLINAMADSSIADCCVIDWSGGMEFRGGYIIIERLIAFDGEDYVERIDRSKIEWVSHTCPHIDGIQVKLIVPPVTITDENVSIYPEIPVLKFKAGEFEREFTLAELAEMELHVPIDRCGNGIMISSHLRPFRCPEGYMFGGWQAVEPDTLIDEETGEMCGVLLGRYRGVWMSEHGMAAGFLRGVAGTNSIGEKVFFGKYIDFNGRFRGILRGTWNHSLDAEVTSYPPHGWYEGIWMGRAGGVKGPLKGKWIADEAGHGYFNGVWKMNCYDIVED
ncbi:MAG: hypothetical protein KAV42_10405 [Candidatus Krumholzibacteria bacterium]|nr:hypothetical protein [Candidatus Krumholzibacteria bacterium]